MITSTLGRKVFDQTSLPQTIEFGWWVERRLQGYKIGGLVKLINQSKKLTTDYMDGYLPKWNWSERPMIERVYIANHAWLYELLQLLNCDFPWGDWSQLVRLNIGDFELFRESIYSAIGAGHGGLNYALAIFMNRKQEMQIKIDDMISRRMVSPIVIQAVSISKDTCDKWSNLKDKL